MNASEVLSPVDRFESKSGKKNAIIVVYSLEEERMKINGERTVLHVCVQVCVCVCVYVYECEQKGERDRERERGGETCARAGL